MSSAQKLLIVGGLILAVFGMLYGLHYALFVEHQMLDSMGSALSDASVKASERQLPESGAAIDGYARTKYVYVRQVDVHSHWIGLAMLLIVLGVAFDHLAYEERIRLWIAIALLIGAVVFPLGVLLQTAIQGPVPSGLVIAGSTLVTSALILAAIGFVRVN